MASLPSSARLRRLRALASSLLVLGCSESLEPSESASPPPPKITVSVTTKGTNQDPDGYVVVLDGQDTRPVPINGEIVFTGIQGASHTITVAGLAPNCRIPLPPGGLIDESTTVTSTVTDRVAVLEFEITCWATGTIRIQTTSTGPNVPGLLIAFVDHHPKWLIELSPNGTYDVEFVTARAHRVSVSGCGSQVVANPLVKPDEVVTVTAAFQCP
jgi:hypothetical protein